MENYKKKNNKQTFMDIRLHPSLDFLPVAT